MIVPDEVRKCVVFIGFQKADGSMMLAGSGFFIGDPGEGGKARNVFLVTARHVIEGIRDRGLAEVFVRGNTKAGEAVWARSKAGNWRFHPTDQSVDVAVLRLRVPKNWDHLVLPTSICITQELMERNEVGLGDEVFVVGLFRHHHGKRRNIPIVRVGNLAATKEEKVATKSGPIDALLIEARSIGGLSGSPVFLNLGVVRFVRKSIHHAKNGPILLLLGLIHGHYDVESSDIDEAVLSRDRVNTGIAIVVPVDKVVETTQGNLKRDG